MRIEWNKFKWEWEYNGMIIINIIKWILIITILIITNLFNTENEVTSTQQI